MSEFKMLVGLPACGKSTYSAKLEKEGYSVFSSDSIRQELGFGPGEGSGKVFELMQNRTRKALSEGKNVIYDATNLSRKNRVSILESIKNYDCDKECVLFTEPIEECIRRDDAREGFAHVGKDVIKRMSESFTVPMAWEGFDKITRIQTVTGDPVQVYLQLARFMEQDNHHHDLPLLAHMKQAAEIIADTYDESDKRIMKIAALYHDIGKLNTKKFIDSKGNPSKEAHYYGHENVGAYMFLSADTSSLKITENEKMTIASLINWHMRPYLKMNPEKRQKEYDNLGEKFTKMILCLHKADDNAHTRKIKDVYKRDIRKVKY